MVLLTLINTFGFSPIDLFLFASYTLISAVVFSRFESTSGLEPSVPPRELTSLSAMQCPLASGVSVCGSANGTSLSFLASAALCLTCHSVAMAHVGAGNSCRTSFSAPFSCRLKIFSSQIDFLCSYRIGWLGRKFGGVRRSLWHEDLTCLLLLSGHV